MIKKTYLTILSIAIISVLLAPTYGIKIVLTGDFLFVFNPKETFLNITDLWIFMIYSTNDPNPTTMNIALNGVQVSSDIFDNVHGYPTPHRIHLQDSNIYGALNVGINAMTLDVLVFMFVYEISVFIEYEYQAR